MSFEKDYSNVFPVTLFECFDEITPMHFIFSLKKEYKRFEEIKKILCHCGAKLGFHKNDITDYSIVIVDHNEVVEFYGPTFKTDFITDCLQSGKLQDIGKYRQEATSHLVDEGICMQVVYYRRFGWRKVVKTEDRCWIDLNFKVKLFKDDSINYNGSPKVRHEDDSTKSKIREDNKLLPKETYCNTKINEDNRMLSRESDINEKVNTRLNSKLINDESDSRTISNQVVETEPLKSTKTKHSPVKGGHEDNTKSKKEDKKMLTKNNSDSNEQLNTALNKRVINDQSDSRMKVKQVTGSEPSEWIHKTKSPIRKRSKLPIKLLDIEESSSEDESKQEIVVPSKKTRMLYTDKERWKILNYIVKHNKYSKIKGREMWMIMECQNVCPRRTWQSMKEHFIKKIMPNIDEYDFLTKEQKTLMKKAYY